IHMVGGGTVEVGRLAAVFQRAVADVVIAAAVVARAAVVVGRVAIARRIENGAAVVTGECIAGGRAIGRREVVAVLVDARPYLARDDVGRVGRAVQARVG